MYCDVFFVFQWAPITILPPLGVGVGCVFIGDHTTGNNISKGGTLKSEPPPQKKEIDQQKTKEEEGTQKKTKISSTVRDQNNEI